MAYRYNKVSAKPYANPFRFPTIKRRSQLGFILIGTIFFAALFLFYWLFLSPKFAIRRIELQSGITLFPDRARQIIAEQMNRRKLHFLPQNNLWIFDTRDLIKRISEEFAVDLVNVRRLRPQTIKIAIAEEERRALVNFQNSFYALNGQGAVLGQAVGTASSGSEISIYMKDGKALQKGDEILSAQAMRFVTELSDSPIRAGYKPMIMIIEKPRSDDLQVKTNAGWHIYLKMNDDIKAQLENLDLTLKNSIAPDEQSKLEYIDLRFGEKVYYKYK